MLKITSTSTVNNFNDFLPPLMTKSTPHPLRSNHGSATEDYLLVRYNIPNFHTEKFKKLTYLNNIKKQNEKPLKYTINKTGIH